MLRKFSKKVQVKPTQLLTSQIQIQTSPFTNSTFTITTQDFASLLACTQKFEIQKDALKYEFSYSVNNTRLSISRRHTIYNDEFQTFLAEDAESSFQVPRCVASKVCMIAGDTLRITLRERTMKVEADSDVHVSVTIKDVEHVSGNHEASFRMRSADAGFLSFLGDEDIIISTFNTCVMFCVFDSESTTVARVPVLQ